MGMDFYQRALDLVLCLSPCDKTDGIIDDKKAAEIKQGCIKDDLDRRVLKQIEQNWEYKKAIQFTAEEMNILRRSNNLHAVVGAGVQSDPEEPIGTKLLELAAHGDSPSGLALVSLIDRYFALQSEEMAEGSLSANLQSTSMRLLETRPENSLAYYLAAYKLHMDGQDDEALLLLRKGNELGRFTSYSTERFFAVVEAAESIGYTRFAARQHAANYFTRAKLYSKFMALCKALINSEQKEDSRKECLAMGAQIEMASYNTFEKLQGLIVQSIAVRESSDPKDVERMELIVKKQREALTTSNQLLGISFRNIPEDIWLQYFDIFFGKNEKTAIEFMTDYHKTQQQNSK